MGKTVSQLLKSLSSKELTEWMIYYELEPFGEDREDFRMGVVASTIANVNRSKNSKVYKPQDFIPKFGDTQPNKQTWQEQLRIVESLNFVFNRREMEV